MNFDNNNIGDGESYSFICVEEDNEDDEEPSQGINVITDEQKYVGKPDLGSNMFEAQFSEANSDKKYEKRSEHNSIEKGLEDDATERKIIQKEEDEKTQDSLAEYEKLISEKLEQK